MPVRVDHTSPLMLTQQVANVHVSNGVSVNLIRIPERVTKSDQRRQQTVGRPQQLQPLL